MLVDLETARRNLKQLDTSDDDNIVTLLASAEAAVLEFMNLPADSYQSSGNPSGVPAQVTSAILVVLRNLYDEPGADPITPAVRNILVGLRDPVFA